ncbi:MAG: hypothetical protein ABIN58_04010 [candidate division WOR-3 bacterium]
MSILHSFVSAKPDGPDSTLVRPSNWNAAHVIEDQTIGLDHLTDEVKALLGSSGNIDGGAPDSEYGGAIIIDAGGV